MTIDLSELERLEKKYGTGKTTEEITDNYDLYVDSLLRNGKSMLSELRALRGEVARLIGLVKSAEYPRNGGECAWCNEQAISLRCEEPPHRPAHHFDCPAFNPDGTLREVAS